MSTPYKVTITAGGHPLTGVDVMLYLRDPGGGVQIKYVPSKAGGKVSYAVPAGYEVAFVEPVPESGFWIILAGAPPRAARLIACRSRRPAPVAEAGGMTR